MKTIFTLLCLLIVSRGIAQIQQSDHQLAALNPQKVTQPAPLKGVGTLNNRVIFTYRGGFVTHHDMATYLRDTAMGSRSFCLIQLSSGEIRRVPAASIKLVNENDTPTSLSGALVANH